MTANHKTKRDRAAGRAHRHTAIQTIIDNHDQVRTDIDSLDNSVACLQDETCSLGSRLDHWYTILDEKNAHTRQNVAHTRQNVADTMRCVVENERKAAEVESAVGILQHTSKEHQKAIAQLIASTNKVHGKQTNLNRELNLTRAAVDEVRDDLMWFGRLLIGLSATTILAYLILFLIVIAK